MKRLFLSKNKRLSALHGGFKMPEDIIYAIGDVHGLDDLLKKILEQISEDIARIRRENSDAKNIKIIFLGDYIDRGMQSKGVIERLVNFKIEGVECRFLKGNHEEILLEFLENSRIGVQWCEHGGLETLASYNVPIPTDRRNMEQWETVRLKLLAVMPAQHVDFLKALELYIIDEPFFFVHAGIDPNLRLEEQSENEFLWIRGAFLESRKQLPYIVVHGHTPEKKPVWDGRRIGLDTGAYMTQKLTVVRLSDKGVQFLST